MKNNPANEAIQSILASTGDKFPEHLAALTGRHFREAQAADLETFFKLLSQLSDALCDLGYRGESRMLNGVKLDLQQRLASVLPRAQ